MPSGEVRFQDFTWRPIGRRNPVIAGFDLVIEPGERVLLVGPSGAGKSTLLHGLAGALGSTIAGDLTGSADVDGRLGLLLQNPSDAIVAERMGRDVAFGPENAALPPAEIWSRVDEALAAVGLTYGRDHFTAALSGGEQQRLALAGVLAMRPDVLLLDEPTSMLDDATAASVREAILAASGDRTLIVVEHRIEPWLPHVDRVVVLAPGGTIVSDGTVASFLAGPRPAGVWMPGVPTPEPLDVPAELVSPAAEPLAVAASDVSVELVMRTLRGTQRTQALVGLSAAITPGVVTGFTGPSGAGKSTALAVLGGLLKPASGTVTPELRRRRSTALASVVGWVPQNPEHGFLTTTVGAEVRHTAARVGRVVDVAAVLEVFGLERFTDANPYRLSGGEQRRLALAAALAHRPGVVLLDEPTVGQDPDTWAAVAGWIESARAAGATVGVSTHDADLALDVEHRMRAGVLA
ncbi:MAG: ATP-binding cassette domain-containing protein [Aeromicrobium sp.]